MDFNAMDNRKCTICDFVFDQDCDDCPAMPSQIRSRHHPTKRTQGVAHKGVCMTDKTAIEKSPCQWCQNSFYFTHGSNIMKEPCFSCVDTDNWGSFVFSGKDGHKALAAIEAEKPSEGASVGVTVSGPDGKPLSASEFLDKLMDKVPDELFRNYWKAIYAEMIRTRGAIDYDFLKGQFNAYHAEQCKACKGLPDAE